MKILTLSKNDGTVLAKLRCDMLSTSPANFTVMQIKDANGNIQDALPVGTKVRHRVPHSWNQFLADCTADNVRVDITDNGVTTTALLNAAPVGTTYPLVSATAPHTFTAATDLTGVALATHTLTLYNSSNVILGVYTISSSSYSAPNTSIVVSQTITSIATSSGDYFTIV